MLKSLEILNTELRRFSESRKKRQRYLNKRGVKKNGRLDQEVHYVGNILQVIRIRKYNGEMVGSKLTKNTGKVSSNKYQNFQNKK